MVECFGLQNLRLESVLHVDNFAVDSPLLRGLAQRQGLWARTWRSSEGDYTPDQLLTRWRLEHLSPFWDVHLERWRR